MDEPAFHEPWHAQVFAITLHLHQEGMFKWPEWADRFSATLKNHGLSKELDGGDDYFIAWLETLESFLKARNSSLEAEISETTAAWRDAYLRTPHGHPVKL